MSGAKLLGTVLRSVAGSRAARTVKEIMPRRISFVPAEKPESLNRDMERLRFVPLNGPGAAAAARHASKKDSSEKDEDDGEEDDDEEEDEDDEDDEEDNDNPLGFPSSHLRDLTVWYTALSATKRTEMRNVGAGLVNVGNTCFLDATLQCLTHTVPFASYFLAGDIAESHNSSTCTAKSKFCLTCTLSEHITRAFHRAQPFTPRPIVANLRLICKSFRVGRQEDAHECLTYLLDGLQNDALRPYKRSQLAQLRKKQKPGEKPATLQSVRVPPAVEQDTWVHKLFGGMLGSCVRCTECGHESVTQSPFFTLSLDIKRCDTVDDALALLGRADVLDGSNKYRCDGCSRLVRAHKFLRVARPPLVLALHLKRFTCGLYGSSKVSRRLEYPLRLQLPVHFTTADGTRRNARVVYDLVAVLIHEGNSTHAGHYFAFVKGVSGQWYEADDEYVKPVNVRTALNQSAYILFYVRNPGAEPIFGPNEEDEDDKKQEEKQQQQKQKSKAQKQGPAAIKKAQEESDDEEDDEDDEDDENYTESEDDDDDDDDDDGEEDEKEDEDDEEEKKEDEVEEEEEDKEPTPKKQKKPSPKKRARSEEVAELLQKPFAGSLFHANDLPTWDDDSSGKSSDKSSDSEGEEAAAEQPTTKRAKKQGEGSSMHWSKQAMLRERHTLIARATPKPLRPSRWDAAYDAPRHPKVRTEVVRAEDVAGKFDQYLVQRKSAKAGGFKSDWSEKLSSKGRGARKSKPSLVRKKGLRRKAKKGAGKGARKG